jgi:hypothetical protein
VRALFRLDDTARRHPAVVRWLEAHPGPIGALGARWLEHARRCGEDVAEVLHDGQPTVCVEGAAFAYVGAFTAHAALGFFQGAELPDPAGLLEGRGKHMRHVKLRPEASLDEAALSALVEAAYHDVKRRLAAERSPGA